MSWLPVTRTSRAEDDLIEIWLHVASDSEAAADRLLDRIETRWQQLSAQPYSGMARDDVSIGTRHLVVGNYLIFYRVERDEVVVLRVLDGRRNITTDDFES